MNDPGYVCCPLCGGDWNPKGGCKACGSPIAVEIRLNKLQASLAAEADVPSVSVQTGPSIGWRERFRTELRSFLLECNADKEAIDTTPHRFLNALEEMTKGYSDDPEEILSKQFEEKSDEVVISRHIEFTSLCEHHLLPFVGTADVGYIPGETGRVVGLSKLARLVDCFAQRLQMQERMCREIADALMAHLQCRGAAVVVRAHHSCMGCRGVRKSSAEMVTSCMRGLFRDDVAARAEFLNLCGRG